MRLQARNDPSDAATTPAPPSPRCVEFTRVPETDPRTSQLAGAARAPVEARAAPSGGREDAGAARGLRGWGPLTTSSEVVFVVCGVRPGATNDRFTQSREGRSGAP